MLMSGTMFLDLSQVLSLLNPFKLKYCKQMFSFVVVPELFTRCPGSVLPDFLLDVIVTFPEDGLTTTKFL